ncbi:MAG: type II toxin-antitoxin system HicB family antitoxin [Clostridia bacterium]|nr:type II toxin-antitoxin system HicB family antitoxin [Clostridia bacterium]
MLNRVNLYYPAIFRKEKDGYFVRFPDIPELDDSLFGGETVKEAYEDATIQLGVYFDNEPENPPVPSAFDDINDDDKLYTNEFVMLVFVSNTNESLILDNTNAGEAIVEGLKKRNLTAAQAGKILGVSEDYIEAMISGEYMPTNPMADRMALLFDFDEYKFFELLEFDDDDSDEDDEYNDYEEYEDEDEEDE